MAKKRAKLESSCSKVVYRISKYDQAKGTFILPSGARISHVCSKKLKCAGSGGKGGKSPPGLITTKLHNHGKKVL